MAWRREPRREIAAAGRSAPPRQLTQPYRVTSRRRRTAFGSRFRLLRDWLGWALGRIAVDLSKVRRYLTGMRTAVSTKGQIVIPAEIRQQDEIEAGQEFEIERVDRGEYLLRRLSPPLNQGLLDWLLACPEKGFFVPIESESTDTL